MLAKMKPAEKGGSRIAIIFNGSPLSNGDCGSGESEIRRWILENDWLDAIVMLPDQLFYNTGIYTYVWLLRNNKPRSHRGRVMIIDARKQFEKEPKSFGSKRNRMTDSHRQWMKERYDNGWKETYPEDEVRIFNTKDFAYHKVSVVFWQADENDKPAVITEPYEKAFTSANLSKEQAFYEHVLTFRVRLKTKEGEKTETLTLKPEDSPAKKCKVLFGEGLQIISVEWTHRHYVKDDEYVPYSDDIETFLKREIGKPIIRWKDSTQLGYEMLPNKYFYKYQAPTPAGTLLDEFWRLEREAEGMLEGLAASTNNA
jgi:type I restriction enzyme M protein